ncbi:MAG: hypothetical protein M3Q58_07055 [Bacteroidota bacterium]|nr:hypothetical protein [Bacteroidota bacterium]
MNYLDRHAYYPQKLFDKPNDNLGIVVVIPAFCEPLLLESLISIKKCDQPICSVEVIVVINHSIEADELTKTTSIQMIRQAQQWIDNNNEEKLKFHIIEAFDFPQKIAGVGLARKVGMDEAVRRFQKVDNAKGIICCFDADSCCDKNYLTATEDHFKNNPKTTACSIYFEHPLKGEEFSTEIYTGILNYELHLRYYIAGLRYANHPFAYHTIGSSMAVRSNVYQKQGGMNKKKAGEDFYFLHKIIPLGNFSELNTTKVIPSPRPSERVPFGTGRAINSWLNNKNEHFLTYDPKVFQEMKSFLEQVDFFYLPSSLIQLSEPVNLFLKSCDFEEKLKEIKGNCKDLTSFQKRFYIWFDGFKAMKFIHFMRENYYSNINISQATQTLLNQILLKEQKNTDLNTILENFRKMDFSIKKGY